MANPNLVAIVADALDMISMLSEYGTEPMTIGWWRGEAYVHVWNFRRGAMEWKRFATTRPAQKSPKKNPFESTFLHRALLVKPQ